MHTNRCMFCRLFWTVSGLLLYVIPSMADSYSSHYVMVNMMKILTIAILFSQWHNSKVSIISSLLSDFTPLCLLLQDIHELLLSLVWLLTGLWFHYLSSIPRMLYQCYQCFWERCNHSLYQTCCQWSMRTL